MKIRNAIKKKKNSYFFIQNINYWNYYVFIQRTMYLLLCYEESYYFVDAFLLSQCRPAAFSGDLLFESIGQVIISGERV